MRHRWWLLLFAWVALPAFAAAAPVSSSSVSGGTVDALLVRAHASIDNLVNVDQKALQAELISAAHQASSQQDRSGEARLHLALARLLMSDDTAASLAELARAEALDKTAEGTHYIRGVALRYQNKLSDAEAELRLSYVMEPAFLERAAFQLGLLFQKADDQDRAYAYLTRATRMARVPLVRARTLAEVAIETGHYDQAIELMDRVTAEAHAAFQNKSLEGVREQLFGGYVIMHRAFGSDSYLAAQRTLAMVRSEPLTKYKEGLGTEVLSRAYFDALQLGDDEAAAALLARLAELPRVIESGSDTATAKRQNKLRDFAMGYEAELAAARAEDLALVTADPHALFEKSRSVLQFGKGDLNYRFATVAGALDAWLTQFGADATRITRDTARLLSARVIAATVANNALLLTHRPLQRLYAEPVGEHGEIDRAAAAALQAMGQRDAALSRLRSAASKQPEDGTLNELADLLAETGGLVEAEQVLRQAINTLPSDQTDDCRFELARLLATRQGRYAESWELLKPLLWSDHFDLTGQLQIAGRAGDALYSLGRYDEEAAIYQEALRRAPALQTATGHQLLVSATVRYSAARLGSLRGDYTHTIEGLQALLKEIPDKIADDPRHQVALTRITVLRKIAGIERTRGRYDAAQDALNRAVTQASELRAELRGSEQAANEISLARLATTRGDQAAAYQHYLAAYDLDAESNEVDQLLNLEWASRRRGKVAEANRWLAIAHARAITLEKESPGIGTYSDRAAVARREREYTEAIVADQARVKLAQELQQKAQEAEGLLDLAEDQESAGHGGDAVATYLNARDIFRSLSLRPDEARAELALANIYDNVGDVIAARTSYQRAIDIQRSTGFREREADSILDLAYLEREQGRYAIAASLTGQALAIYLSLSNPFDIASTRGTRALIQLDLQHPTAALEELALVEPLLKQTDSQSLRAQVRERSARAHAEAGDLVSAERDAREAVQLFAQMRPDYPDSMTARTLADILLRRIRAGNVAAAERPALLHETRALLKLAADRDRDDGLVLYWRVEFLLGQWHELNGESELALASYRNAISLIERRRRGTGADDAVFLDRFRPVYIAILDLLERMGRGTEMFDYASKLAAAEYAGASALPMSAMIGTDAATRTKLLNGQGLRRRLSDIDEQIEAARTTPGADPSYQRWLERVRSTTAVELATVRKDLDAVGRDTLGLDANVLTRMHRYLPADALLLQPALLPDRVVLLIYTREQSYSRSVPLNELVAAKPGAAPYDGAQLRTDVEEFLRSVREKFSSSERINLLSERLYDAFIRKIEPELEGRKVLLVSPLGLLRQIPFAALHDRVTGKYLVERLPIVNVAQSIPVDVATGSHGDRRMLALIVPEQGLQAVKLEGLAIAQNFPTSRVLTGADASASALDFSGQQPGFDAVVFATHARFDESDQYVQLANGERLSPTQLTRYAANWRKVSLVVMSACETAVFTKNQASPFNSFIDTLEGITVPSVIGTQWRVDDAFAGRIMQAFYENLHRGAGLAAALQQAQISAIKDARGKPYFWAPYQLYGDWR